MEDVLGGRTDSRRFSAFLANWQAVLARRVDQAVAAFADVDGVSGLVLAGSIGRGELWPLSDIDLLPIYDDDRAQVAQHEVERRRVETLRPWIDEGWWTGLDIGRLMFLRSELDQLVALEGAQPDELMRDDRWYYSIDKGYRGRAVYDPEGLASRLARWLSEHRFAPDVVQFRLQRERREVAMAQEALVGRLGHGDHVGATVALRAAVKWLMIWQLEIWGERDVSQGRIGTRFTQLAKARSQSELALALDVLSSLADASVEQRMAAAPDWVWERHDRSFLARCSIGEGVSRIEDARDTLRVCAMYETRRISGPPFPAWLAIPTEISTLDAQAVRLAAVIDWRFADASAASSDL